MSIYEKRLAHRCGTCGHFIRHYVWKETRDVPGGCFLPLALGHCTYPTLKDRRDGQACPLWIPRTPEMDPPDVRMPEARTPDR